jgi:hypothetical protein
VRAPEEELETDEEEEDGGTGKVVCFGIAEEEEDEKEGFGRFTFSIPAERRSLLKP